MRRKVESPDPDRELAGRASDGAELGRLLEAGIGTVMTRAPPRTRPARRSPAAAAIGLLLMSPAAVASEPPARWKLFVDEPGPYALPFEDLAAVVGTTAIDPGRLRLRHRGEPVPLWIESLQAGRFGPGDRLLFLATRAQLWPSS